MQLTVEISVSLSKIVGKQVSKKMNIVAKLKRLFEIYRIPLYLCGLEVFDSNYHFNLRTLIPVITCLMYYICALNTVIAWPLMSTLELLSACGIAVTVRRFSIRKFG
jgi:hypothetical protein